MDHLCAPPSTTMHIGKKCSHELERVKNKIGMHASGRNVHIFSVVHIP